MRHSLRVVFSRQLTQKWYAGAIKRGNSYQKLLGNPSRIAKGSKFSRYYMVYSWLHD